MSLDPDIEMNKLSRIRSPRDGSNFTVHRPGTAPFSSRRAGGGGGRNMKSYVGTFIDSFRRGDGCGTGVNSANTDIYQHGKGGLGRATSAQGGRYYNLRSANTRTASSLLARELKSRHLQMIAFGGSIGTGLFVASGKALSNGGPASVLLAYMIVGVMVWCTMQALGEMAVLFPVAGSFSAYSTRFLDPSWGFAMGWK
jgi:amino acid transporter